MVTNTVKGKETSIMNNFKKFIAITSCAAMLFSFVACGKKVADDATTTAPATQATTVEATTKVPEVHERIAPPSKLIVWTKGEKVEYTPDKNERKVNLPTAAANDSTTKGDKFSAYTKAVTEAEIEKMKKEGSCFEFVYNKEQHHSYLGEDVHYDTLVIATSGDHINTMFFLKGSKLAGKPVYVEKGAQNKQALSERVLGSIASK